MAIGALRALATPFLRFGGRGIKTIDDLGQGLRRARQARRAAGQRAATTPDRNLADQYRRIEQQQFDRGLGRGPLTGVQAARNKAILAARGQAVAGTGAGVGVAAVPFATTGSDQGQMFFQDIQQSAPGFENELAPDATSFTVQAPDGPVEIPTDVPPPLPDNVAGVQPVNPVVATSRTTDAEQFELPTGPEDDDLGLDPQFDLPGAEPTPSATAVAQEDAGAPSPQGVQSLDSAFQVPEGQELFGRVENEQGGFGEIFASPEAIARARARGGGGVTTVPAGEFGGEQHRARVQADFNRQILERLDRTTDPDDRADLFRTFERNQAKFEQGVADRATAEKFGISEQQARTLRGDFGKQPGQQRLTGGQGFADPRRGGRFFIGGAPEGQVFDQERGLVTESQAAQLREDRDAANLRAQQGVQAIVDANLQQRELEAEQAAAGQPTTAQQLAREKFEEQKRATAARETETQRKAARQNVLDAAPTKEEGKRRLAETLDTQRRGLNISADAVRRLREGAQAGQRARLIESGFIDDFAEGGIGGAISNLLNSMDFGEGISQALGIEEGEKPAPRNAFESIERLEALDQRFNGPNKDLEIEDMPEQDAKLLQEAFDMLPEMRQMLASGEGGAGAGVEGVQAAPTTTRGGSVPGRKDMIPSSAVIEFARTGQPPAGYTADELEDLLRTNPEILNEDF